MSGTTHDGGRVTTRPIGRIQDEEDLTFQMGRAAGPRESGQWPLHANFPEYARECPNIPDVSLKPELRVRVMRTRARGWLPAPARRRERCTGFDSMFGS